MGESDRKNQNHILHFIHEKSFFNYHLKKCFIAVKLIYNVLVSGVQQSESVTYIHISILFWAS